jgi:hypothetical protein
MLPNLLHLGVYSSRARGRTTRPPDVSLVIARCSAQRQGGALYGYW